MGSLADNPYTRRKPVQAGQSQAGELTYDHGGYDDPHCFFSSGLAQNRRRLGFIATCSSVQCRDSTDAGMFGNSTDAGMFGNSTDAGMFGNSTDAGMFGNGTDAGMFGNSTDAGMFGNSNLQYIIYKICAL